MLVFYENKLLTNKYIVNPLVCTSFTVLGFLPLSLFEMVNSGDTIFKIILIFCFYWCLNISIAFFPEIVIIWSTAPPPEIN